MAELRRRTAEILASTPTDSRSDEFDPQRTRPAGVSSSFGPGGGTVEQAKEVCLRLLAVRARSRAELARRLADKGFAAEVSERALDRLGEVGLVDDAAFARQWVRSRHAHSGRGRQALAHELRRKGISADDAAPALDTVTTEDERARATELVRRKLRTMAPKLDRDKKIRRLVGMLARRGYGQSVAYAVVTAELAADSADPVPEDTDPLDRPSRAVD
ncbi:recombination regulator RecX [Nocardia paucivorans]|uniref:recombination regulator RecX n=1 Tax=Nocardia paucivorans TaxID=114259 RepID=UPI001FE1679F|nr:recombination regulator RecX [Nocardia paucivorans]